MFKVYTFIIYLLTPILLLRSFYKYHQSAPYLKSDFSGRWKERFAFYTRKNISSRPIWIHAVSVGEFIAVLPLIKLIQKDYPDIHLLISCTTLTGSDRIIESLGKSVDHVFLPWDTGLFMKSFYHHFKPRCGLIMETEIWPNLLIQAKKNDIPVFLINARMSEKSASGYLRLGKYSSYLLNLFSLICSQNKKDGERFKSLGLQAEKHRSIGNLKFDLQTDHSENLSDSRLNKISLGWQDNFVIVAASTHDGEEKLIVDAFVQLKDKLPSCRLVVIPRHPERFTLVESIIKNTKLNCQLRTKMTNDQQDVDILLGDSMGEMMKYYALADLVIMGGSLINRGGHNILEPASLGLPVITGPYMFNFEQIKKIFLERNALICLQKPENLGETLLAKVNAPELLTITGNNASNLIQEHSGARQHILKCLHDKQLLSSY